MKNVDHAYAVIRIDKGRVSVWGIQQVNDVDRITVKEIVWSKEKAQEEVSRLNELNKDKNCFYFWQLTRVTKRI